MRQLFSLIFSISCLFSLQAQENLTPYEKSGKTATATYAECTAWYEEMHKQFPDITEFQSIGRSDGGFPIYVFRINTGQNPRAVKVLVMNNIHPGEPEGTDASMLLAKKLLQDQKTWKEALKNIDLHIICQYNTDGTVNRSCCSRANQNGPSEYGFRATAKNLDLNRDFVKTDSRNTAAFVNYFLLHDFQIFIDNHTSNGADYAYTLTYFHTRKEKLDAVLEPYLELIDHRLKKGLEKRKIPSAPYVDLYRSVPDSGIVGFWESPRYSTGFASLHHCIGFTVETHMFKPFSERVDVTLVFMEEMLNTLSPNVMAEELFLVHRSLLAEKKIAADREEYIAWKLNENKADSIPFLGYEFAHKKSSVTGHSRLYYDRTKPWTKVIPYYNYYVPADSILLPRMYIIPQAWSDVTQLLQMNGMDLKMFPKDTSMLVRVSHITGYETVKSPYESHYMHYNTRTKDTLIRVQINAGDRFVAVTNTNRKFLAATLEPRSQDSYFNWNYFDGILQQKEWFSDYVFVDKAEEILAADSTLKSEFEKKKRDDAKFAMSSWDQLAWIYRHSAYYEKGHNRYPVYRLD